MERLFTQAGYENHLRRIHSLEEQLDKLQAQVGGVIESAPGDMHHDNAFYDHLVEDIRVANTRLEDAHNLFSGARVIQYPQYNGKVNIGTRVRLILNGHDETFDIVAYGEADINNNKILYDAPVAQAMMGHVEGDEFLFDLRGDKRKIKILKVEPIKKV